MLNSITHRFIYRKLKNLALYCTLSVFSQVSFSAEQSIKVSFDDSYQAEANLIQSYISELPQVNQKKLAVSIGLSSFKAELQKTDSAPILALHLTSKEFNSVVKENLSRANNNRSISAVFYDIDPRLSLALADILSPTGKKYVPYSSLSQLSMNKDFESYLKSIGGSAQSVSVSGTQEMLHSMDNNDALVAYSDDSLFNQTTIKPIISSLYRRKKFLIGFSANITKSGALASVYPAEDRYNEQYLLILAEFNKNGRLPGLVYSRAFDVSVNQVLAKALGYYSADVDENKLKIDLDKIKLNFESK